MKEEEYTIYLGCVILFSSSFFKKMLSNCSGPLIPAKEKRDKSSNNSQLNRIFTYLSKPASHQQGNWNWKILPLMIQSQWFLVGVAAVAVQVNKVVPSKAVQTVC